MSNNLMSQPLMTPNQQIDHIPNKLEVPMPDMQTGMVGGISGSPRVQEVDASHNQMAPRQPMPSNFGYYNPSVLNGQMGQKDMHMSELGLQPYMMTSQHDVGSVARISSYQGSPKISLPIKRTAAGEHIVGNFVGQQLMTSDKTMAQVSPISNKHAMQQQASRPALDKKMVRNDSISGRSGSKQVQAPKSQTMRMEPTPKNKAESFESVRSKMRESLASALALINEAKVKASKDDTNTSGYMPVNPEKESSPADKSFEGQNTTQGIISKDGMKASGEGGKSNEPEFQYITPALSGEEVPFADSFFVQDELLQGNGLAWVTEFADDVEERNEVEMTKKPKLMEEDASKVGKVAFPCPQSLASKIEAELFKLFGGVNKKYKEKGRSLLFNLKDRNNLELRERVMAGEISPERLCAMSAEELASKELSEWRMAKAEEFDKMVILPDSDVDIRRLVRKTHKGEFQVEVEQDDGVSVEVSVGTTAISRPSRENKGATPSSKYDRFRGKDNVVGEKSGSDKQDISCSLTIPNDVVETDFMQGLMADEFKDVDFLPPIVSLDEFMQSLDTEPPFENLHVDGEKTESPSDKESSEGQDQLTPTNEASKEPPNATAEISGKGDTEHEVSDVKTKSTQDSAEQKSSSNAPLIGERVWEGLLQLNISAGVNAVGLFRSGEKTSTKEWPPLLEIKGRVRYDDFEKFVQVLPKSRSRAVMLAHFALKEGSFDADHATLEEAVQSYVLDERLGIAEPVPGSVEIYFCPPHPKIIELLGEHLFKSYTEILNSIQKGFIGVIIWRRPHIASTLSPNSNSHHKHASKRPHHHYTPTTAVMSNNISNVNFAPHQRAPPVRPPPPQYNDEDDDDIPPGFGPAPPRSRDEDDLPEFNFSGRPMHKQNVPNSRPVDQMRELILKYGQMENNNTNNNSGRIGTKRWNDDDEDDIPEWQPGVQPTMAHRSLQPQAQPPPQMFVPLQANNNMVQVNGRWLTQMPPSIQGQKQDPSANIGSQVYGAQRYPRTRGFYI